MDIVHGVAEQGGSAAQACRTLIAHAALQWRKHEGDYRDDITATVLWLPDVVRALSTASSAATEVCG